MQRSGCERDGGYSLVELMTIVGIIAVLVAIAIPIGFRARTTTEERVAQTNLRTVSSSVFAVSADDGFFPATAAELVVVLTDFEPAFTYVTDDPNGADVAVQPLDVGGDGRFESVLMMSRSSNGECFAMRIQSSGPAGYAGWTDNSCLMADAETAVYAQAW